MTPSLSMRGVTKRYRGGVRGCSVTVRALCGVDLDVGRGEVVGLVGGAGAGKSTLLLCAAGLLRPDRGTVAWFGVGRHTRLTPPGVVYVSDRAAHYGFLTVREAVEYHATLHDAPGSERGREVAAALERTGLAECAHWRVGALPRGMLRRVALAQALVRCPRLLLLDELLTALDAETREELHGVLRAIAGDGVAVLATSGEGGAMDGVASRLLLVDRGVVRGPVAPSGSGRGEGGAVVGDVSRLPVGARGIARVAESGP